MLRIQLSDESLSKRQMYRTYSPTAVANAYQKIISGEMSTYKASRVYGVPKTTLIDRVAGRVNPDTVKSGPDPVLSLDEEAKLAEHIKKMASHGYGYTRSEVLDLATDLAIAGGKIKKTKAFSLQWFRSFMGRWPELKLTQPRALDLTRAKSASVTQEKINSFFDELEKVLTKYNLTNKPECIYNIDEKCVNLKHKPSRVVSGSSSKTPAIKTGWSSTITVIGAGNALGTHIPPYLIFQGARRRQELLDGCTVGSNGTVSSSGLSNTEIFKKYLQDHFINYVQGLKETQPILIIYDGHISHVSLSVIEWAKASNIILLVLPAHTSHILQPLDVGCYGPLSEILSNACHKENQAPITRYNIGKLASESYVKALSNENLTSSFRKTGIFPLDAKSVDPVVTLPSNVCNVTLACDLDVVQNDFTETDKTNDTTDLTVADKTNDTTTINVSKEQGYEQNVDQAEFNETEFFSQKEQNVGINVIKLKQRNVKSNVTAGKAITEESVVSDIKLHCEKDKPGKTLKRKIVKSKKVDEKGKSVTKGKKRKVVACKSQEPGPS